MPFEPMPPRSSPDAGRVGSFRQHRIDGDQVLNLTDFGRQDDAIARQADLFGKLGGNQCRLNDGFRVT